MTSEYQLLLHIQVELAPEFTDLYAKLKEILLPQIILDQPNKIASDNLVHFKNPVSKKLEIRVLD